MWGGGGQERQERGRGKMRQERQVREKEEEGEGECDSVCHNNIHTTWRRQDTICTLAHLEMVWDRGY